MDFQKKLAAYKDHMVSSQLRAYVHISYGKKIFFSMTFMLLQKNA
jgi:hypothetical protein